MSSSPTMIKSSRKIRILTTSWYMRINCKSLRFPVREKRWPLTIQCAFSAIRRWTVVTETSRKCICTDKVWKLLILLWRGDTCKIILWQWDLSGRDFVSTHSLQNTLLDLACFGSFWFHWRSERERETSRTNHYKIITSKWSTVGFSDDLLVRRVRIWILFLRVVLWLNL